MRSIFRVRHSWFLLSLTVLVGGAIFLWFYPLREVNSTLIVIKIAAMSAIFSAIGSFGALMQALEAQKQRESVERPAVVCYFDATSHGIYFVIQNLGNAPAVDVKVSISPPTQTVWKGFLGFERTPISFLPPGKLIRQFYGFGTSILNDKREYPTKFTIEVTYFSLTKMKFRERVDLDISYMCNIVLPASIETHLGEIAQHLSRIEQHPVGVDFIGPPSVEHSLAEISKQLSVLIQKLTTHKEK